MKSCLHSMDGGHLGTGMVFWLVYLFFGQPDTSSSFLGRGNTAENITSAQLPGGSLRDSFLNDD